MSAPGRPHVRRLFALVVVVAWIASAAALYWAWRRRAALPSGEELNKQAWEATFRERQLPVPASGPRDGYWGKRMPRLVKDPDLGWREAQVSLPGLVETGPSGVQVAGAPQGARCKLLIVGGSVAWGAYASSIDTTYFNRLARKLAERNHPVEVTVLAAGAWDSDNERRALEKLGFTFRPSLILFLNGTNDVMDAARRHKPDRGGSPTSVELRAALYLENMQRARELAALHKTPVAFALQPFLPRKTSKSPLEQRIVETTFDAKLPLRAAVDGYTRIETGLAGLCREPGSHCVDVAHVFDREKPTTFTDVYHFSDSGHELLAEALAQALTPILDAVECGTR